MVSTPCVAGERAEEERVSVDLDALFCCLLGFVRCAISIADVVLRVVSEGLTLRYIAMAVLEGLEHLGVLHRMSVAVAVRNTERDERESSVPSWVVNTNAVNTPGDTRANHLERMSSHRAISAEKILEPYKVATRESSCETLSMDDPPICFLPGRREDAYLPQSYVT